MKKRQPYRPIEKGQECRPFFFEKEKQARKQPYAT
jgi:hypothetical protein